MQEGEVLVARRAGYRFMYVQFRNMWQLTFYAVAERPKLFPRKRT